MRKSKAVVKNSFLVRSILTGLIVLQVFFISLLSVAQESKSEDADWTLSKLVTTVPYRDINAIERQINVSDLTDVYFAIMESLKM